MSTSFNACRTKGHAPSRHSPNGVDIVFECAECCMAWMQKPSGELIRLYGEAERRLIEQKLARPSAPAAPQPPPRSKME
jgi:hypothetical protein